MTDREFFVEKVREEVPIFERLFKALPVDKLHHTHHPKSKTAGDLAVQMAGEAESFVGFLTSGVVDWSKHVEIGASVGEISKVFSDGMNAAADTAGSMSEEEWASECTAVMNGAEVMKTTRGKMAWLLVFDLVHHRGQLSTYIRPMGGKVPSIYGPSGDTM